MTEGARAQRDALWSEVSSQPYRTLPPLGSTGVGNSLLDTMRTLLRPRKMAFTFRSTADALAGRAKLFHPFGAVACVDLDVEPASPYTGLLGTSSLGLLRLSWATNETDAIPGVALKLFVAGATSRNVLAVPSLDPQPGADFFDRAPTTRIPMPRSLGLRIFIKISRKVAKDPLDRPVRHLCDIEPTGAKVTTPVAPAALTFEPSGGIKLGRRDLREALAELPLGTELYRLVTIDGQIGTLRTSSQFVASAFGDRVLHFHHSDIG